MYLSRAFQVIQEDDVYAIRCAYLIFDASQAQRSSLWDDLNQEYRLEEEYVTQKMTFMPRRSVFTGISFTSDFIFIQSIMSSSKALNGGHESHPIHQTAEAPK